jgi:cobalt-zinc-cadmium efflux system membrane fusion protein
MNLSRPLLLGLLLALPPLAMAQEQLPLDAATQHRLGLSFIRLAAPDASGGAAVPARVSSSPAEQAAVLATHAGVLDSWLVAPGTTVAAGTLLGRLRSPELLALQQDWLAARAETALRSSALQRDRQLLEDGIIAAARLQVTEREAQAAQTAEQAAAAQLQAAGFDAAALAALASERRELGYQRIVAPHAGTVAHLNVLPGTAVSEGEPLVAVTGAALWVEAEVPARLAAALLPGQALRLDDSAAPLQLKQRDAAIDPARQTIGIRAEFQGESGLLPGQLVTLRLPPSAEGVLVPADAVVRNGTTTLVYVRNAQGVEARPLQLRVFGSDYLADSGIAVGEEVVIRGAALLKGIQLGLGGE